VPGPYVIQGTSYGTAVAQVVGDWIRARDLPAPRAIMIDGVMSRAYRAPEDMGRTLVASWPDQVTAFSPAVRAEFAKDAPFGITRLLSMAWVLFNDQGVIVEGKLLDFYSPFSESDPTRVIPAFRALFDQAGFSMSWLPMQSLISQSPFLKFLAPTPIPIRERLRATHTPTGGLDPKRLSRVVGCAETDESMLDTTFEQGAPVLGTDDFCGAQDLTDHAFDTHRLDIRAPLFIAQGTRDLNTPPWGAEEVFDTQTQAPRLLVRVAGVGHGMAFRSLFDCLPELMDAWFADDATPASFVPATEAVLDGKCSARPFFDHRASS
jgi:hypothetical protein